MTPEPIEMHSVTKRYDNHVVFAGVDLTLQAGTVTALTGPNGVGKTTVGRLLLNQ